MKQRVFIRAQHLLKFGLFVLFIAVGSVLYAQQNGIITGTVQDPRGAALPSAAVTVKSDSGAVTRQATTDAQGRFTVSNLPAGKYAVQVTGTGFEVANKTGVQVTEGQPQDVTIGLSLGNVAQQVRWRRQHRARLLQRWRRWTRCWMRGRRGLRSRRRISRTLPRRWRTSANWWRCLRVR